MIELTGRDIDLEVDGGIGPSTAPAAAAADHHQLQALRTRTLALLSRLGVEDDAKLADWLSQRLGLLQQRDTAMLHRLLHDIEKNLPE